MQCSISVSVSLDDAQNGTPTWAACNLLGDVVKIKTWYTALPPSEAPKMPLPHGTTSFLLIMRCPYDCCVVACTSDYMGLSTTTQILKIANNTGYDVRHSSNPQGCYGVWHDNGDWYFKQNITNGDFVYYFTAIYI